MNFELIDINLIKIMFKIEVHSRITVLGYHLFPMDIRPCFHVTIHLQSLECITLIKINQPGREWFEIVC